MSHWKDFEKQRSQPAIPGYNVCANFLTGCKMTEPRHDKTNNVAVRPAKTQISLGTHSFCWFCHVAAHVRKRNGLTVKILKIWKTEKYAVIILKF